MSETRLTQAREGARAYFNQGRCSGHAQFNGRYCRDAAGPDQWCIHCAGYVLLAEVDRLTAQHAAQLAEIVRLMARWQSLKAWLPTRRDAPNFTTIGMIEAEMTRLEQEP